MDIGHCDFGEGLIYSHYCYKIPVISIQEYKINKEIAAKELRVIDEAGGNVGVLSLDDARHAAEEKGLDLILIVPNATPPVARIMSFDKFRYIKDKEAKKQKAAQKAPEQKQIQISAREAENDLVMKMGRAHKFIESGHRVEVAMRLRGREKYMKDWSRMKMEEFMKMLKFPHKLIQNILFDGKSLTIKIDPIQSAPKPTESQQ
ncbi:MAG: translation initiation factor IF-3 [Candidatus Doudnabacteria bacterium RIFCSPHIGHO2_01_FULL_49_9]|uniref:Translation initiation factor IF-3 n=1 Tax=Candidatus Doudnabacteria bacterium RIFCSPHIGHO2_01_FULL_49_9 TaxID=1817827 RepID=A0A1F5NYZ5_9BACT|nr:MAG: translation initiation factor IF-3 [Candidatus Doudnabacteria bacterium RIFCSPHIGHO2_01_FULL_49_9]